MPLPSSPSTHAVPENSPPGAFTSSPGLSGTAGGGDGGGNGDGGGASGGGDGSGGAGTCAVTLYSIQLALLWPPEPSPAQQRQPHDCQ